MQHIITVMVENEFGVLARVAGLFSGRGFNIESLSVAPTLDPTISRMTIVTEGDEQIIEQIIKQLRKLVNILKVSDLTGGDFVNREMVFIKVSADQKNRAEVLRITDIFRGKVIDVSPNTFIIEVTGDDSKINAIVELLKPIGIKEIARTGKVAMARSGKK